MLQLLVCLLSVVVLFSGIGLTHQQIFFCPSPNGYDVTNITVPEATWQFNQAGQCLDETDIFNNCTFSFSLCRPLPVEADCSYSSVCQVSPAINKTEVGHFKSNPFVPKDVNGFYAVFNKTKPIVNRWNKTCNLSIVLDFNCNKNVPWISTGIENWTPEPTGFQAITEDNCEMVVKFDYAGACFRIIPVTTISPNPEPNKPLSAGSVLLIFFFVTLFTYLIVGSFYNAVVAKESGLYILPNIRTWVQLILLVSEGFAATWNFVTCRSSEKQLIVAPTYSELA